MVQKNKLLEKLTHLKRGKVFNQGWTEESPRPRDSEEIYRRRWQHDRIVRSTHGVRLTVSIVDKLFSGLWKASSLPIAMELSKM